MTKLVRVALLCAFLPVAVHTRSQSYPRFELDGRVFVNNSYIHRGGIGEGDNALKCVTNNTDCCTDPDTGNWTDGNGAAVHQGMAGATTIYITRGRGVVSLNRITNGSSGMWRCDIPDSSGLMRSIYIYTGATRSIDGGICRWISHTITSIDIHTGPNISPPEFTLTCRSEGAPATTVTWWRNRRSVKKDGDHEATQVIVDTTSIAAYENKLRVRGREGGDYQCWVTSEESGGSCGVFSNIFVQVAGEPTNLAAVQQSDTSIEVRWYSPGSPATGYVIYYQPEGGAVHSVNVTGGDTESYMLEGLQKGMSYQIAIMALSEHLPSALIGPITTIAMHVSTTPSNKESKNTTATQIKPTSLLVVSASQTDNTAHIAIVLIHAIAITVLIVVALYTSWPAMTPVQEPTSLVDVLTTTNETYVLVEEGGKRKMQGERNTTTGRGGEEGYKYTMVSAHPPAQPVAAGEMPIPPPLHSQEPAAGEAVYEHLN